MGDRLGTPGAVDFSSRLCTSPVYILVAQIEVFSKFEASGYAELELISLCKPLQHMNS